MADILYDKTSACSVLAVKRSTPEDFRSSQRMCKSPIIIKQVKSRFRQVFAMPSILANYLKINKSHTRHVFSFAVTYGKSAIHLMADGENHEVENDGDKLEELTAECLELNKNFNSSRSQIQVAEAAL